MKIDDKITTYGIDKYLSKSSPNGTEKIDEKRGTEGHNVEGQHRTKQDAVVNLSQESKEAQKIREIISSEPDVREDKVSALKERLESGRYRIDNEKVAEKLVDSFIDEIA